MKNMLIVILVLGVIAPIAGVFLFNQDDDLIDSPGDYLSDTPRNGGVSEIPPHLLA